MDEAKNYEKTANDEAKEKLVEAAADLQKEAKSFYKENKQAIDTILFVGVTLYLIRRGMRKELKKQLDKLEILIEFKPLDIPSSPLTGGTVAVTAA
jgi:F0F1-type ATP synthase membrane subunit b/b'